MSERDAAAVRVDVVPALLEARVARELKDDAGKGLVHLDDGHIVPGQTCTGQRPLARLWIAVQHPVRIDACEAEGDEARPRLQPEAAGGPRTGHERRCGSVADLRR